MIAFFRRLYWRLRPHRCEPGAFAVPLLNDDYWLHWCRRCGRGMAVYQPPEGELY